MAGEAAENWIVVKNDSTRTTRTRAVQIDRTKLLALASERHG